MKLRNKKTGEIQHAYPVIRICDGKTDICFASLAELNEEWEDYKPTEPLIKDEKVRKAVRAWAEASYLRGAIFDFDDGTMTLRGLKRRASISFDGLHFCEFKHITAKYHTIEELCGEGEV